MVVPNIGNPFFTQFMRSFHEVAAQRGFAVHLIDTDENAAEEIRRIEGALSQVDGFALVSPRMGQSELRDVAGRGRFVLINRKVEEFPCIWVDSRPALREALRDLAELGHDPYCETVGFGHPDAGHFARTGRRTDAGQLRGISRRRSHQHRPCRSLRSLCWSASPPCISPRSWFLQPQCARAGSVAGKCGSCLRGIRESRGGNAVAKALVGETNPAGRLPITFYRSDKDLPPFEDYHLTGRTYRYFTGKPLFPFGYGLSYSTFQVWIWQSLHTDRQRYPGNGAHQESRAR